MIAKKRTELCSETEFRINPLWLLLSHRNWSFGSNDNICCQCAHSMEPMDPMRAMAHSMAPIYDIDCAQKEFSESKSKTIRIWDFRTHFSQTFWQKIRQYGRQSIVYRLIGSALSVFWEAFTVIQSNYKLMANCLLKISDKFILVSRDKFLMKNRWVYCED